MGFYDGFRNNPNVRVGDGKSDVTIVDVESGKEDHWYRYPESTSLLSYLVPPVLGWFQC